MGTPSKCDPDRPSAAPATRSPDSISMIRVLKVNHHSICVFGYFGWGPTWPLSCNNPPNGQISPHGDTKQMRPRPSFCRPQHTLTSLYFHDSSSQSHPSLHMCVSSPLLRSGLRNTSTAVFSITATTRPHVLNVPASLRYAQTRPRTARF
jgi:hypothetical protein